MKRFVFSAAISLVSVVAACGDSDTPPSDDPPPTWGVPITGGTMTISKDGKTAVVADPDRDRVVLVDLATQKSKEIPLNANDEPGRVIEDGNQRYHVALRRGGALLTLSSTGEILARRPVCAEPRGLAWDSSADTVIVACATGELVTFPSAGGNATRNLFIERDLRDVVVRSNELVVTKFRSAYILHLDANGNVISRDKPPVVTRTDQNFSPVPAPSAIAWRSIALPDGRVVMSHQRQVDAPLHETEGGYGGGCDGGGPAQPALSVSVPGHSIRPATSVAFGALPVDIAASPDGTMLAFAVAGNKTIQVSPAAALDGGDEPPCGGGPLPPPDAGPTEDGGTPPSDGGSSCPDGDCTGEGDGDQPPPAFVSSQTFDDQLGAPTSVAFTPGNDLVAYYPEVPAIVVHKSPQTVNEATTIILPGTFGYDAGRQLFHTQTGVGIACASCHPEGQDDGLTWTFAEEGKRRTQNVAGHILARAPYHWTGDQTDLGVLMDNVFTTRMEGGPVSHSQKISLGPWLDRVPAHAAAPIRDQGAVDRGKALFQSNETQCTSCHNGPLLTNKAKFDVGTNGVFEVPSLIGVGGRAPYMHTGCAATLEDRFGSCGGGDKHGHTSQLSAGDIADLAAYLDTL